METAAIATLRTLHVAQTAFRRAGHADRDGDGVGEYGTMVELVAADLFRDRGDPGTGYRIRVCHPGSGEGGRPVDADRAEEAYLAIAWPFPRGCGGRRSFRVDETGTVWAVDRAVTPSDLPTVEPGAWTKVP